MPPAIIKIPAVSGGGPTPVTGYDYGEPYGAGGTTGGGTVIAQWIFNNDKPPATVVDVVNGKNLTNTETVNFNYSCNIDFNDYSPLFKNGIRCIQRDIATRFVNTTTDSKLYFGTDSVVIELVLRFDNASGTAYGLGPCPSGNTLGAIFDVRSAAASPGIEIVCGPAATGNIIITTVANDATTVATTITNPFAGDAPWQRSTRLPQKWRLVLDRPNNLVTLYVDGVSIATSNISALSGKAIDPTHIGVWSRPYFSNPFGVSIAEMRITKGTTTANSGGPGGG